VKNPAKKVGDWCSDPVSVALPIEKESQQQPEMKIGFPFKRRSTKFGACTLCDAPCGGRLRVLCVRDDCPARSRLHEMGFCVSVEFKKVADGGALICQLLGARVAIGRELGRHVLVEPVDPR
jgi:Fe2+ transport system protein FeoA